MICAYCVVEFCRHVGILCDLVGLRTTCTVRYLSCKIHFICVVDRLREGDVWGLTVPVDATEIEESQHNTSGREEG